MNNNEYCVYVHKFPNNKLYIGITKQNDLDRRWQNGIGYRKQKVYRAITKYGWDNVKHIIMYKNLTLDQARFKERLLIKLFNTCMYNKNSNGYNCTIGGEGSNGHKLNPKQREAIRERKRKENLSKETIEKMKNARIGKTPWNKGKIMTEEWKIINPNENKYIFPKGVANPRSKSCICENIVYETIKQCWEHYSNEITYDSLKYLIRRGDKMPKKWKDRGLSYVNL